MELSTLLLLFWKATWLLVEVAFFLVVRYILVPRANQRTPPQPYRDYGRHRHLVILRIIDRMYQTCRRTQRHVPDVADQFLREWFLEQEQPEQVVQETLERTSTMDSYSTTGSFLDETIEDYSSACWSSAEFSFAAKPALPKQSGLSENSRAQITAAIAASYTRPPKTAQEFAQQLPPTASSSREEKQQPVPTWTVDCGLRRDNLDEFVVWAMFQKEPAELQEWERAELAQLYQQLQQRAGLTFEEGRSPRHESVRCSVEDVRISHRPLCFYLWVTWLHFLAGVVLRCVGFQRVVASTGLVGWYRSPRNGGAENKYLPLFFFHGVCPGGLFFYLPMVLWGLVADGRATFLFENPNISSALSFEALREPETVDGVVEICDRFLPRHQKVSVCGHSFGSNTLTWLLHAPQFAHRIQQFVLLDPVSILLSEPDVIMNFFNPREPTKIGLASTELFTQYYLRRHFAWYNSELWMDDIPDTVRVLVSLAHQDEVLNAPKVREHVALFANPGTTKLLYAPRARHADCVLLPKKWRQVKQAMWEQELAILADHQKQQ